MWRRFCIARLLICRGKAAFEFEARFLCDHAGDDEQSKDAFCRLLSQFGDAGNNAPRGVDNRLFVSQGDKHGVIDFGNRRNRDNPLQTIAALETRQLLARLHFRLN